jgi:hypothetical protein
LREEARTILNQKGDTIWGVSTDIRSRNDSLYAIGVQMRFALEGVSRVVEHAQDVLS